MLRIKKIGIGNFLVCAVIFLFALFNIFLVYWMLTSSFKASHIVSKMPPEWFPLNPTIGNFKDLMRNGKVFYWVGNSFFISGATTLLVVLISSLAAYSFAKLEFAGKNIIFMVFISTLMIPKEVFIVPLFKVVQYLNLMESYVGVILPNVALPFGVFLLKQFFETIPNSLRESAKIDGYSEFQIFRKIMLPLAKPGIAALTILMFIQVWNDYLWQMVMIRKDTLKTLQLGVASMQMDNNPNYGLKFAGAVCAALPMLIIFLVFQRYFTEGITMGAVKE